MTREEAARILDETPIRVLGITETLTYLEALEMGVEALQEKDHRCDNCSNGENAGVRIYCLLHTSFHRLDEYCSEWEEEE